ncbi:MAG: M28 family peptidase [Clostridiales bacterium]|nr:M28 family peptidase [Clostridiales bacterium]
MKKTRFVIIVLCIVLAAFALISCGEPGAPEHTVSSSNYTVKTSTVEQNLEEYVKNHPDRTAATDGEENAAIYLLEKLDGYGLDSAEMTEFTYTENNKSKTSRNVSAVYKEEGATKNVIIGAYYDNCYGLVSSVSKEPIEVEGALANGSGVAAALAVAEYLGGTHDELGFNVTLAFFGSSAIGDVGAREFYKSMSRTGKENTVLMVELQRLGVDHVYAYSGPGTKREAFFARVAKDNEYNIYKTTQKSPHIVNMRVLDGVPYYEWAQTGLYNCFYNGGIPTLNVVGANWETISLTDKESANNPDIAFTSADTFSNLKRLYPDYGSKIALAASFVIASLHDPEFISVMTADKRAFNPNAAITRDWIWGLVLIAFLVIAYVVMNIVVKRMGKKYPVSAPQPKKIKMAVFGVDYEDGGPNDIFIDFADSAPNGAGAEEIFPGIPNNDKRGYRTQNVDDIFPPIVPRTEQRAKPQEPKDPAAPQATEAEKAKTDNNNSSSAEPEKAEKESAAKEKTDEDNKTENATDEKGAEDNAPQKTGSAVSERKTSAKKTDGTKTTLTEKPTTKKQSATTTKKSTTKSGLTGSAATTGKSTQTKKPTVKKPTSKGADEKGETGDDK